MARRKQTVPLTKAQMKAVAKAQMDARIAFLNRGRRPAKTSHFKPGTKVKVTRWPGGASIVPVGRKGAGRVVSRPSSRPPVTRRR